MDDKMEISNSAFGNWILIDEFLFAGFQIDETEYSPSVMKRNQTKKNCYLKKIGNYVKYK